jgi:hypothetical protein
MNNSVLILDDRKLENNETLTEFEFSELIQALHNRIPMIEYEDSCLLNKFIQKSDRIIMLTFLPPRNINSWNELITKFKLSLVIDMESMNNNTPFETLYIELSSIFISFPLN